MEGANGSLAIDGVSIERLVLGRYEQERGARVVRAEIVDMLTKRHMKHITIVSVVQQMDGTKSFRTTIATISTREQTAVNRVRLSAWETRKESESLQRAADRLDQFLREHQAARAHAATEGA